MSPLGILYGSIEGYLHCGFTSGTHVLQQTGLIKPECPDTSLDICQVDELDTNKMAMIQQLEAKRKRFFSMN